MVTAIMPDGNRFGGWPLQAVPASALERVLDDATLPARLRAAVRRELAVRMPEPAVDTWARHLDVTDPAALVGAMERIVGKAVVNGAIHPMPARLLTELLDLARAGLKRRHNGRGPWRG